MNRQLISKYIINLIVFLSVTATNAQKKVVEKPGEQNKYNYELFNGIKVGVDLGSPFLEAVGQDYGAYQVVAEANLLNRFFPEITFGVGHGKTTNEDNITAHCPAAPFFKIGMNYNFNYNDEAESNFVVGLRYGFTSYKSSFSNLSYDNGYWPDINLPSISDQKFNTHWLELGVGIRVHICPRIYMGWNINYSFLLSEGSTSLANPWYIPGYGVNGKHLNFTYNIYYELPFWSKKKRAGANFKK